MKHYTLTAEQMQQVREALTLGKFSDGIGRTGGLDWAKPNHPTGILYTANWDGSAVSITQVDILKAKAALALLDAAMQAPEATDPLDRPMGGHLLDSVRYPTPPEATAGGDVRELLRVYETALTTIGHDLESNLGEHKYRAVALEALTHPLRDALAAAPKHCEKTESECAGCETAGLYDRDTEAEPHTCHGTKPEAPTDATPKDEETGR